ncbi:hypothetical protein GCM10010472_10760 [Pseudonocardia halophobica]|uniref:Terminase n=1 Tax=Pseudonocardia halophobica TaxID=29401 RepID=A0A9W6L577_9PSEU|nr:hypothetical protein [Pseudonocardia halophobica]GLL13463.1 hypothetical protein GCM10017577_46070 [Pseudonocardia halophobica]
MTTTQLVGIPTPRLSTEPLRPLTPETSLGFEAARFSREVLGVEPLPWQEEFLIRALELRPDGGFRFRTVLLLVGRQNGKTYLCKLLALWMMFTGRAQLVLGCAQSLDVARESWQGAVDIVQDDDDLRAELDNVRHANGEQTLTLTNGARYKISAATRSAGRGLSVDLLLLDELREHRTWDAWAALSKTTTAKANALILGISNAGETASVVLNALRSTALSGSDPTLGIFEWSAPENCELDDPHAWAQANPGLGHTVSEAAIRSDMMTSPAARFRTESLCCRVDALDSAVDLVAWQASVDHTATLAPFRDRVAACVDVAPDGAHVTLAGAAQLDDGSVRVEVFAAWESVTAARRELPGILARIAPRTVAWFPSGPAAGLAADLRSLDTVEIKGAEVAECCQELATLVTARQVRHPGDPLLDAHVAGAGKAWSGDSWRFTRSGGHVDALYAVAGAVHAARTAPVPVPVPRSRVFYTGEV